MNSILTIREIDTIKIASFDGISRFNSVVSQTVKEQINQYLAINGSKVVLDLEGVKFIDSSAFGSLISVLRTSKEHDSTFMLCNPSAEVKELINIMQLDTVFSVFDTLDECLESSK